MLAAAQPGDVAWDPLQTSIKLRKDLAKLASLNARCAAGPMARATWLRLGRSRRDDRAVFSKPEMYHHLPPLALFPNALLAVLVFVLPKPPLPPNPPLVLVLPPNMPPPLVVAAAGAPNAGLLAPKGELLVFVVAFAPKPVAPPPNPPEVAVPPPKSDPLDVVFVFAPNPVFELPKPPKVELLLLLLPLPKPKDIVAVSNGFGVGGEGALVRWRWELCALCAGGVSNALCRQKALLLPSKVC